MTNLRRSCAACAKAKHRCDLQTPKCSRCRKGNKTCIFANEPLTSKTAPIVRSPTTDQASYKSVTYTSPRLLTSHNATEGASDVLALPMVVAAGFLDPFDSYPQTNLPRLRVQGLIHHFLSKIAFAYYPLDLDSKSNPFVVSWWPLALKDPALFHVSLQTASLDDELLAQNGFPDSNVLMAESVSLVRRKVQDPSLAFQDETMDAVVTLAAIEYGKGELHTSKMHIDGVIRMVAVRGGIQAVKKSSPLTARMVPWVSMLVMGIPQFPTQDDAGHGDGISTIQLWKDSSFTPTLNQELVNLGGLGLEPELFDTLLRLRNIFYRFSIRDSQHTELPTTDLHDLTCFVLHRLLPLPSLDENQTLPSIMSHYLRCSTAIYMFLIHGHTYYSHGAILSSLVLQLKAHLEVLITSPETDHSLIVWGLSLGMVASLEIGGAPWFIDCATTLTEMLEINSWEDVVTHLRRVLWLDTKRAIGFKQPWDGIFNARNASFLELISL